MAGPVATDAGIRLVAALAGVSVATVSRAMHEAGSVAPDTRRRVRDAAAALHYQALPAARAVAHARGAAVRPVSLQDVAVRAGVSPATASRALAGRSGVARETRDRVALAASDLGYAPLPAAVDLARCRARLTAGVNSGG